jgi:hypothetical protein
MPTGQINRHTSNLAAERGGVWCFGPGGWCLVAGGWWLVPEVVGLALGAFFVYTVSW